MSILAGLFGRAPPPLRDETEEILRRHLTGDFVVFPMAEAPTSPEAVLAVGRRLGVPLPAELLAHLSGRFPGIWVEAKESIWPRPKPYEVGPFWSFLYGVHTFTAAGESEDWMRMETAALELREQTGFTAMPVLKVVGDADLYCVDSGGQLVQFNHELDLLEPVELGFFALFEREVEELVKRVEQKKAGSGSSPVGSGPV